MKKVKHVLLTGGVGSRLWPLSRKSNPKQYINLFGDQSLFEIAIERNQRHTDMLCIVGNGANKHLSMTVLDRLTIKQKNIEVITEATPRNTASAIAFAAFSSNPDDILLVTPSDHIIQADENYNNAIKTGLFLAEKGYIATFGITPQYPETGYGYIEYKGDEVISFREKPDLKTAEKFVANGNFLWNSGMFCFTAKTFLDELKTFAPDVYEKSSFAWSRAQNGELNLEDSLQIPAISIDYAILEKSKKIKVVKSDIHWSDMGSFESVYQYLVEQGHPVDENGNMVINQEKPTFFMGLTNVIVIHTKDATLILQKENAQDVKDLYMHLENTNEKLID